MPIRWLCKHPISIKGLRVPCGQCKYCRINNTRDWTIRCLDEFRYYKNGCFVTLTYDSKKVKENIYDCPYYKEGVVYSLHYQDLQDFLKRLRDFYELHLDCFLVDKVKVIGKRKPKVYPDFKYLACGEYGDENNRPHFHICFLGLDFKDKYPWHKSRKKKDRYLYRSPTLEKLWKYGHCDIAILEDDDVSYCAGYEQKKIKTKGDKYYKDKGLEPPKRFVSKGFGKKFVEEFKEVLKRDGFTFYKGKKASLPPYYRNLIYSKEEKQAISEKYVNEKAKEIQDLINKGIKEHNDYLYYFRFLDESRKVFDEAFDKKYKNKPRDLNERR